jgi:hypothetical protein
MPITDQIDSLLYVHFSTRTLYFRHPTTNICRGGETRVRYSGTLLTSLFIGLGDYCDVYLTHDSMSVRRAHNSGRNHLRNVVDYYQRKPPNTTNHPATTSRNT